MSEEHSAANDELSCAGKGHGKMWRHPSIPGLAVSHKCAAAVALMQMGISDCQLIAQAVDLEVATVEWIDAASDCNVRSLAVAKIPNGEFFKLRIQVLCPKCHAHVHVAPCVLCAQPVLK